MMINEAFDSTFITAVSEAFDEEYGFINEKEAVEYRHEFSEKFRHGLGRLLNLAEQSYVRFGKKMIRRGLAVALIALMMISACGIVYAMGNVIINWTTVKSEEGKDNLSVWFEAENTEGTVFEKALYKPQVPEGMTEISEDYYPEALLYNVEYRTSDDKIIKYIEAIGVTDEGKYFGVKVEGMLVEEVMVGECSGTHYYDGDTNENTLLWTDGSTLFALSGEMDYETMVKMAENLELVNKVD